MLEEHVVQFIRKWPFPLGFFREQGGESIHHEFVQLASTYYKVKPDSASQANALRALCDGPSRKPAGHS